MREEEENQKVEKRAKKPFIFPCRLSKQLLTQSSRCAVGNSRLRNAVEGPSDGGCPGSDVTDCPVPHCSLLTSVPVQRILPNLHPVLPSLDRKHKKHLCCYLH